MKAIYLRFPDEKAAEVVNAYKDRELEGFSVAVIGKLYDITGEAENMVATELPGWHVNMLAPDEFEDLKEYEVTPENPRARFWGW